MPTSQQNYASSAAVTLTTTAETVVATFTTPPLNTGVGPTEGTVIGAEVTLTPGTAATAVQLRVRQGSLAGAVVGNLAESPATAAVTDTVDIQVTDPTANYPAGNTYVLTAQQVAATGNGTVQYVNVLTEAANSSGG